MFAAAAIRKGVSFSSQLNKQAVQNASTSKVLFIR
jgi:hypothetical protein